MSSPAPKARETLQVFDQATRMLSNTSIMLWTESQLSRLNATIAQMTTRSRLEHLANRLSSGNPQQEDEFVEYSVLQILCGTMQVRPSSEDIRTRITSSKQIRPPALIYLALAFGSGSIFHFLSRSSNIWRQKSQFVWTSGRTCRLGLSRMVWLWIY